MNQPRRAVVSLFNTPAGQFRWYEEFPLEISARLAQDGIDHVLGYKEYWPQAIVPAQPRLHAHDEQHVPNPTWVRRVLAPILARYDQVILHSHSYGFNHSALWRLTCGQRQRRFWATVHTTPNSSSHLATWRRRFLQRLRIRYPDRLFAVSRTSEAALRAMFLPERVGLLRNGRLSAADQQRFPERGRPSRALFVGRLNREKGVWPLLAAAEHLARSRPDFHLRIVGEGPEGDAMQRWISERNLHHRIDMAGYQSEVAPYYEQADFVILPSDPEQVQEGLPLVALEAKAYALPVLYTLSGGLPETQIENQTGLLLDPPDAAHIAAAVMRLLDDVEAYHAMRAAIRAERQAWSLVTMVDAYVAEYLAEFARWPSAR